MLRTTHAFAIGALASASVGGAVLAVAMPSGWSAAAFAATAFPGLVSGILLAHLHGRAGGAFPLVVGLGLLVRFVAAGIVTALAARAGGAAIPAALVGLATGFVPLMAFETWWFARKALREAA
jgi:hypothetical protein